MKKLLLVLVACFAFAVNAFAAININTATSAELESIKGIGPAKAKAIIDYRAKTPFKTVDDLTKVKGFGKKSVDKIRKDISVNGATNATAPVAVKAKTVGNETAAPTGKTADLKTAKDAAKPMADDKAKSEKKSR